MFGSLVQIKEVNLTMSLFCEKCGQPLNEDDIFCGVCGTRIASLHPVQNEKINTSKKKNLYKLLGIICVLIISVSAYGFVNNQTGYRSVLPVGMAEHNERMIDFNSVAEKTSQRENLDIQYTLYVSNCKKSITLRSAPSTDASELAQIPLGQAVGFIEKATGGFYKINYDGVVGYALATYLSSNKLVQQEAVNMNKRGRVANCRESITLRTLPSTSAAEIGQLPLNTNVNVIDTAENGFYQVESHGVRGYVLQQYIELW